ncbi:hypothetical protein [Fundidesulfovibrio putealis]|uniref:hypothetical protein n=1 Tax=Fundidesulfovibrio putealis TaxID=270496 RepID=UPI0012EB1110|nr:hypothetical protein [Fundidesulfovibrio putealis]
MRKSFSCLMLFLALFFSCNSCSRDNSSSLTCAELDTVDFVRFTSTPLVYSQGLLGVERDKSLRWRWALGPRTYIAFISNKQSVYRVSFKINNAIENQRITIFANGQFKRRYEALPQTPWLMDTIPDSFEFDSQSGLNVIEFESEKFNREESNPDGNPYAFNFRELQIVRIN